jgi:hypothetical protein
VKNFHLGDRFRRHPRADSFSRICRHPADLCRCVFESALDRLSLTSPTGRYFFDFPGV